VLDADLDMWAKLFDVNARAPFFLMQAAIRAMRERGTGGTIVNILSMNAHCGLPDLAVYSATQGALATLTRNIANAHRSDRIRVNGINMGWVATESEDRVRLCVAVSSQVVAGCLGALVTAAARLAVFLLGRLRFR
jgi:NAD(P)-dependent dehydrogenase (short-subunit alcohol dehydrogenase family)